MITKYGKDNVTWMLLFSVVLAATGFIFHISVIRLLFWVFGILFAAFTLYFFRDPKRTVPESALNDNSIIISPSDGKIIEIKEIEENKFLNSEAIRISIFLSPLDVHVNWSPVTGKVLLYKHFPGNYLVAYHPKSSELNEHSLIGVENEYGKVLFKQIVGILARRLVCEIKEGDFLRVGQKFGMMKFGSRMDVMLPANSEVMVVVNQRVKGGVTVLGKLYKNEII